MMVEERGARGKMAFYSCFRAGKKKIGDGGLGGEVGGCTLLLRVRDGVRERGRDGRRTVRGSRG